VEVAKTVTCDQAFLSFELQTGVLLFVCFQEKRQKKQRLIADNNSLKNGFITWVDKANWH